MKWRMVWCGALAAPVAALAGGGSYPGNPADMYFLSDAHSEIYQFERVSPWSYVPGTYAGGAMPMVFSNSVQLQNNASYLGAVAGANNNFFIGGFSSLVEIDSATGAYVQTIGGAGARLGPAEAPNGNLVVGGPTGIEEYSTVNGSLVRTVNSYGSGMNLLCFDGGTMFATQWNTMVVKQFDFVSGAQTGPDISVPFAVQELAIGPDGALYASALYEGIGVEGVHRYDGTSWVRFADTDALPGTGPHGFAWDPVSLDLYLAMQTGEIFRFDGLSGAYLNQSGFVPTKLTDVLFHEVVPTPGALALFGIGSAALLRRRR